VWREACFSHLNFHNSHFSREYIKVVPVQYNGQVLMIKHSSTILIWYVCMRAALYNEFGSPDVVTEIKV